MAKKKATKKAILATINVFTPEVPPHPNKVDTTTVATGNPVLETKTTPSGLICVKGNAFYEDLPLQQAAAISFRTNQLPSDFPHIPHPDAKVVDAENDGKSFNFVAPKLVPAKCKKKHPYLDNTLVVFVKFGDEWLPEYGLTNYLGMCSDRTECDGLSRMAQPMKMKRNVKKPVKKSTKKKTTKKKAAKKAPKK